MKGVPVVSGVLREKSRVVVVRVRVVVRVVMLVTLRKSNK